jgi:hypothetical protein
MKVRRKSLWRSKNVSQRFRYRANQRAAKERKRVERAMREEPMPDTSHVRVPRRKPSGFRVTVECLDDGERVSFTCSNGPYGLTISPTLAGHKVSVILKEYKPITK